MMRPEGIKGATGEAAPVIGGDGGEVFTVNMVRCPPGDSPLLHAHHTTRETFLCMNGRFAIKWGDEGEHEITLDPYDMIADKFGEDVLDNLKAAGLKFTVGLDG